MVIETKEDYDESGEYCFSCGNIWELCNCICSFCPFDGKCQTCPHCDNYSFRKAKFKSKLKRIYYYLKFKFRKFLIKKGC
jgi:hypothetical protein